jgi:putative cardiolipin synthase
VRHFAPCSGRTFYFWCLAGLLLCTLGGCGTLPQQVERHPSQAILDTAQTHLGVAVAPELAMHPGMSGFHPLGSGPDAFVARVALVRAAERTLDVQYYALHIDKIGDTLLKELLAAADRGVRVRMLLDDLNNSGSDDILAAVGSHPNVEVRLFNPFVHRHARWLDYLSDFRRINRRMHNKSITADSQISVVGGRNIGDEYFAASTEVSFNDFDVIAIGPVVAEVSAEFDEYWNSGVVYPLSALKIGGASAAANLPEVRRKLTERVQTLSTTPYAAALQATDLARSLEQHNLSLYWGTATLIADQPSKVTLPPEDTSTHAIPKLRQVLDQSTRELILVSPYFVPGKSGERWLKDQVHRGVQVKILTNSFAATDVRTVHSGYSRYRKDLLRAGIELYELKPSLNKASERSSEEHHKSGKSARSSLHAKVYESDGHRLFVGSMNLDPRSASLNTEMGLVIDSEALGADVRDLLLSRLPDAAYRVNLDTSADPKGRLVWVTREDGQEVRYDSEPDVSSWDHFLQVLQRALPIEKQL